MLFRSKELNYLDTIELAYSGAQIIHPKTIKPLQNKNIPLYVRPFGDKRKPGTVIRGTSAPVTVPILILKKDQVFLTVRSRDFSFVLEEKFATIFSLLERYRIKTNLIHNSAVNLGLCVDNSWHIDEAVAEFRDEGFDVMKVEDMELLTIRGYTDELLAKYGYTPKVFVRQTTQSTVSSIYTYLQPVLAIAISVGMGLDKLHADTVVFALVIFVGVALVLRSYSVPPRHPVPPAAPPH